ncbi:L-ascorbate metabolism protein UlaG (beta-lactamase superfamily) [Algoriphagus sp. 4150]|uniref:MBL fold metallo-hydrolase n=1 Tax=Algoriphagus sp. 4150 TaxID=2817756 RepID=UPI00285E5A29|nr:MBL fold metallo-hydrolase [Algoriphagus sp. 4150]MDR7131840.1 L-ascorbate metabolism protein UlaG (beta-lactamase superfamily) [Algoriphagus sp. 4150]
MKLKTHNSELKFVKPDWTGNKLTGDGLYTNIYGDDIKSVGEALRWMSSDNPLAKLKKNQQTPLTFQLIENISDKSSNAIIPLGHASFIVDMNGKRLLIDPVVSSNMFLKRYTQVPFDLSELTNVDYLLLSHNHRDHIDKNSVKQLTKLNPDAVILTGLEIGKILKSWGIKNQVQEAGWYQQYNTSEALAIDYLPSRHWSRRWLNDTNIQLWGSFMIQDKSTGKTIYFAGDSGYGQHFTDIGSDYEIDIAMIGIGAYEPQWFMHPAHTGPTDAIKAFHDLKAKQWIPMHYGTFDLSDEPIFYPEQILREQHQEALEQIVWMNIGKRIAF